MNRPRSLQAIVIDPMTDRGGAKRRSIASRAVVAGMLVGASSALISAPFIDTSPTPTRLVPIRATASTPASSPSSKETAAPSIAQRIGAAGTTAASNPYCLAISNGSAGADGFYWEIDDANGVVTDPVSGIEAAGSINPPGITAPNYTRAQAMPIASASKWLYGAFVAESQALLQNGMWQMPASDVPFLNFTSGYANMQDACSAAATGLKNPTVQNCLNQPGQLSGTTSGTKIDSLQSHFYYNSGHLEVFHAGDDASVAGVMNGADDTDATLAERVTAAFAAKNVPINLIYYTPILAGGGYTSAADYLAFLQGMLRPNALVMRELLKASASDPYAVCTNRIDPTCPSAVYSPIQGEESFHYSLAHWIEDDAQDGDGSYSSPGAFGFYPWLDASKTYAGVVARNDASRASSDEGPGYKSQQCGRAIRLAFLSGIVTSASTTSLASSFNPSLSNQANTFTATVTGNAPTGNVTFSDGNTMLCALVPLQLVGGVAQAACVATLSSSQSITAKYSGDTYNTPSLSTALAQTVAAVAPFNPDQFGLTGAWYNPATSGQGIVLEVYPDSLGHGTGQLFGGFFSYAADDQGGRVWYSLQGSVQSASTTAQIGLFEPATAGNFNAGPTVAATSIGSATITFGDCSHMTISYTFSDGSGRSGTIPLTRLTGNSVCSASGDTTTVSDDRALLSGAWYNPATSGQGMVFDISPAQNILSAAWYTYAPARSTAAPLRQTWYTLQSNAFTAGLNSIQNVPIFTASGGKFNDPTPVVSSQVGTANIAFASDCRSMTLGYTFTSGDNAGQTGSIAMLSLDLNGLACLLP